jgi:hypothetical protein
LLAAQFHTIKSSRVECVLTVTFTVPQSIFKNSLGRVVLLPTQVDEADPPQAHGAVDHVLPLIGPVRVTEEPELHRLRVHALRLAQIPHDLPSLGDAKERVRELVLPVGEAVVGLAPHRVHRLQHGRPVNQQRLPVHGEGVRVPS